MTIKKEKATIFITALFAILISWWAIINLRSDVSTREIETFSDSIWLVGFFGGIYGLMAAKKWGGFKSVFGKSVSLFSLGLLAQSIGQIIYIYYAYALHNENPYPSLADVFFFGTIPLYVLALLNLATALRAKFSRATAVGKVAVFLVPAALLAVTYTVLLGGYQRCFEDSEVGEVLCSSGLTTFLDFAYPLGGAIYISIAILIFILSRSLLGGIMRSKVIILLIGLLTQYSAEFHYLYLTNKGEFEIGRLNDALYLTAYFIVAISLINLGKVIDKLLSSKPTNEAGGSGEVYPQTDSNNSTVSTATRYTISKADEQSSSPAATSETSINKARSLPLTEEEVQTNNPQDPATPFQYDLAQSQRFASPTTPQPPTQPPQSNQQVLTTDPPISQLPSVKDQSTETQTQENNDAA